MAQNLGKKFEEQFKFCWKKYVANSFCYRLPDTMGGYYGVSNVSDFICYSCPLIYLIDCKTHKGNTLNFSDFSQYESMLKYKDIEGLFAGTVIWFQERDKVIWVPIQTWEKIKLEGGKSFNIKMLEDDNYECFEIPSHKKRVFMETNYYELITYCEDKFNGIQHSGTR